MITQLLSNDIVEARDRKTRSPGFFKPPKIKPSQQNVTIPDSPPGRSISARIYPNGEFGVGFVPQRGISAKDRQYERDCRYAEENAEIVADIEIGDQYPEGFIYTRKIIPGSPPKLGIGSKSSQPTRKYGLGGITSYGRKMVRNAGFLIDKACEGRYNRLPQMGTVTVPSYSPLTMERICANWNDIVRKFFQECKRQYKRYRYDFDYVSCTEIQPQRLETRNECGLHLHFLFVAIRLGKNKWVLGDTWVRRVWGRILAHYLDSGDMEKLPNYRRETVRRSSAAYLAKYASKGCDMAKKVRETLGDGFLPRQWWSISSGLRAAIRRHTILSMGELAEKLLVISRWGVSEYVRYIRCITLQINCNEYAKARDCPSEIVLGYGGLLTAVGLALFQPHGFESSIKSSLPRTLGRKCKPFSRKVTKRLTILQ